MSNNRKKALLIILDGWGLSASEKGNAPLEAKTPVLDFVYKNYPKTSLSASGIEVGLHPGEPGNSEVGHMNIGTGRVVWESLPRIDQEIENGELAKNKVVIDLADYAKKNEKTVHLVGIVSDGGVHGHIRHLIELVKILSEQKVPRIFIHVITDGRDTDAKAAENYINQLDASLKEIRNWRIVTMVGRYFAMDRDKNWDRVKEAADLLFDNTGTNFASAKDAIAQNYKNGKDDESMKASVIGEGGKIVEGDPIIMFNYRADRAKQLMKVFAGEIREINAPKGLKVATLTQYEESQKAEPILQSINLDNTLAEVISKNGLSQFHTAETEKFAHVTYFFNAGKAVSQKGEKDILVPSKKVESYDKAPEMSAGSIKDNALSGIEKEFDFILVNFANGDMVGHTGKYEASIRACEAIDSCLLEILSAASEKGYTVMITADHGNCESMIDEESNKSNKEHTTNPVPFVYLDMEKTPFRYEDVEFSHDDYVQYAAAQPVGVLADVAPTILEVLSVDKPGDMSGMDLKKAVV